MTGTDFNGLVTSGQNSSNGLITVLTKLTQQKIIVRICNQKIKLPYTGCESTDMESDCG